MALDDDLDNIEIIIVRGSGVRDITILEEQVLHFPTLLDEESHITPIIKNKVRYVTLTITLRPHQGIQDELTVLLENLTFPGKHSSRYITRNVSHIMVLGR